MKSYITLFGKEIPLYGIAFYTGILLAAAVAFLLMRRRRNFPMYDLLCSAIYVMIGAIVGAKLLFIAVSLKDIIQSDIPFYYWIKGGFVFYGGLIGGAAGLWIYTKQFRMRIMDFVDIYAAVLPLGHSIGRVGCYFAGCCYGIPYDGPGAVIYHESLTMTPLETPLLPIQLIEAAGLMVLSIVLAICYLKISRRGAVAAFYVIGYSSLRFVLEFFRGDRARGIWLNVSTSQWISLALVCVLIFICIMEYRKNQNNKEDSSKTDTV